MGLFCSFAHDEWLPHVAYPCTMSKFTSAVSFKVVLQAMCFSSVTVEMLLEPC